MNIDGTLTPEELADAYRRSKGLLYRQQNRKRFAEKARVWHRETRADVSGGGRTRIRRHHLCRRYGLTHEQLDEIVMRQEGRCGVCGQADARMDVEHDHATGKVRGLVCRDCNWNVAAYEAVAQMPESTKASLEAWVRGRS